VDLDTLYQWVMNDQPIVLTIQDEDVATQE
jgi:hypothetical protein